jgi:hypothetical protein
MSTGLPASSDLELRVANLEVAVNEIRLQYNYRMTELEIRVRELKQKFGAQVSDEVVGDL